jgi:flagellar hook-length control protein FliK
MDAAMIVNSLPTSNQVQSQVKPNVGNQEFDKVMSTYTSQDQNQNTENKVRDSKEKDNTIQSESLQQKGKKDIPVSESVEGEKLSKEDIKTKIVEIVTEQLGITPEMLSVVLDQLNMEIEDLLIPENLQILTKELFQVTDLIEVIMDQEKGTQVKALFQSMENLNQQIQDEGMSFQQVLNGEQAQEGELQEAGAQDLKTTDETISAKNVVAEQMSNVDSEESLNEKISQGVESSQEKNAQQNKSAGEGNELNTFVTKLNDHLQSALSANESIDGHQEHIDAEVIIKQVMDQMKFELNADITKMEFQLKPEHLGKVNLSIVSKEGIITANFIAETQVVKETIESQVVYLKQSLEDQGIKVDKIEVVLSNEPFDQEKDKHSKKEDDSNRDSKKSMKISRFLAQEEEILQEDEIPLDGKESVVNYTA